MRVEMINERVAGIRASETDEHIVSVVLVFDGVGGVIGRRSRF